MNCKYLGTEGYLEIQGGWCKAGPVPVSCSHGSLYSSAPESTTFPGSYTLVLSLIKKQYVAGLTCQIFK